MSSNDPSSNDPSSNDPFSALIDSMLESAGVDASDHKYNPTSGDMSQHDWISQRERLFSGEDYMFRCQRCLKWVKVPSDRTITEALAQNDIDPNCGAQVMSDIMKE